MPHFVSHLVTRPMLRVAESLGYVAPLVPPAPPIAPIEGPFAEEDLDLWLKLVREVVDGSRAYYVFPLDPASGRLCVNVDIARIAFRQWWSTTANGNLRHRFRFGSASYRCSRLYQGFSQAACVIDGSPVLICRVCERAVDCYSSENRDGVDRNALRAHNALSIHQDAMARRERHALFITGLDVDTLRPALERERMLG